VFVNIWHREAKAVFEPAGAAASQANEAETALRQAVADQEKLLAEAPANTEYRARLCRTLGELAENLLQQGKHPEAVKAADRRVELAGSNFNDPLLEQDLAGCTFHRAGILYRIGQMEKAEEDYRQALNLYEKEVALYPGQPSFLNMQAFTALVFGDLLVTAKRFPEAEKAYRQSAALYEKLVADYPGVARYRFELAYPYLLCAGVLEAAGHDQDAEKVLRQGLAMSEKAVADVRHNALYCSRLSYILERLAQNLVRQGKHAEAAKVAEKMPSVVPEDAQGYRSAAHFLSLCVPLAVEDAALSQADRTALGKRYANRSGELIQEADKRSGEKVPAAGQKPKP
jgi:tetratricopeptide (TPR) repeat protein